MEETLHTPVLLQESVTLLSLKQGDCALDATLGLGGHSLALCRAVGKGGYVLGIDADENAVAYARERVSQGAGCSFQASVGNFRDMHELHRASGMPRPKGILFDLGWNSTQLSSGRGFSFLSKDPLVMTYNAHPGAETQTAAEIVNTWSEADLVESIALLGEERFAGRIAHAIVLRRRIAPLTTADDLAETIADAVPPWYRTGRINPATKTFQALRILVNDELSSLQQGLKEAFDLLLPEGRIAVITFHSIEDGLVKRIFKSLAKEKKGTLITKKPIGPSRDEIRINPRARSAKIRVIQKL